MQILQKIVREGTDLKDIEDEIKELTEVKSIDFSYTGSKTSSHSSRTENIALKRIHLGEVYIDRLHTYLLALKEFEDTIRDLDTYDRYLMRLRYLDLLVWEEVGNAVGLSYAQVCRNHKRILSKLKGMKENEENRNAS